MIPTRAPVGIGLEEPGGGGAVGAFGAGGGFATGVPELAAGGPLTPVTIVGVLQSPFVKMRMVSCWVRSGDIKTPPVLSPVR